MTQTHPYVDASYRIIRQPDMSFAVEVTVLGSSPTLVKSFATESGANQWITGHKARVAGSPSLKRFGFNFRRR
ncbi:MAG: hypothetical protein EXQ86_11850 [Rhodospirillales bacterium]|nr:hypothetical protein [Rhodospirillales bacterium]